MICTKYNLGEPQLDGILHTNIQKGKGYCFFEKLDLILPVESSTEEFLERGQRVTVVSMASEVALKSKKEAHAISRSLFRVINYFGILWKKLNEKNKASISEEIEPQEKVEDISVTVIEQRLTDLLEEHRRLYQEIQALKVDINNLKK